MIAPAAEGAPALGYLAIGLLALAMALTLRGVRAAWVYSFGAILEELAALLNYDKWVVHIHLGAPLQALDHTVQNAILKAAAMFDGYAGYFFHGSAMLLEWAVRVIEHQAREVLSWAAWLQRVHLPGYVKWAVRALVPPYLIYKIARAAIAAELPHIGRQVKVVVHDATKVITQHVTIPYAGEWRWIHRHWKGLTAAVIAAGALPIRLPHVGADVGKLWRGLTKRLARIERRLARLEALLGVAGMAAVMANVLGIPSWRCLTRGPIGKVSRALCGLGATALEDLLSLVVDAAILADPCDTMTLLTDAVPFVIGPIDTLTEGLDAAFGRCGYKLAPPMPVARIYTPDNPASILAAV